MVQLKRAPAVTSTTLQLWWENGSSSVTVNVTPPPRAPHTNEVPEGGPPSGNTLIKWLSSDATYNYTIQDNSSPIGGRIHTSASSGAGYVSKRLQQMIIEQPESWHRTSSVFDILLPNSTSLLHYIWPLTALPDIPLKLQDTLALPTESVVQDTAISLIQSWQTPNALEALARITTQNGDDTLIAFQFIPGSNRPTSFPVESDGVIDRVTGSPALIQDDQDLFNLLVPRAGGLFHYTHTNETLAGPWELKRQLTVPQGLSVVSLGFTQTDGVGGMVAVARVQEVANASEAVSLAGSSNTNFLVSYTYVADKGWQEPMIVELGNALVIGTPALIASNTSEGQERLELLVPTTEGLKHLINTPDAPAGKWQQVTVLQALKEDRTITPVVASLVQTEPGKLQAFVRAETSDGQFLLITYSYSRATGWSGPAKLQVPDAPNGDGDGHGHGGGDGDGHGHGGDR